MEHSFNNFIEIPALEPTFAPMSAIQGTVLLAEDNPVNQEVAKAMLSKLGLAVHIANNGQEAVDLVHSNHYDLILMDCQMPLMDGYQATSLIRKQQNKDTRLPIIALTANATECHRTRCIHAVWMTFFLNPTHWINCSKSCFTGYLRKKSSH